MSVRLLNRGQLSRANPVRWWGHWCQQHGHRDREITARDYHIRISSLHYGDVIMSAMASQITGVAIVYSTVCSGADQRKHQSSASLAFVRGIHRWPAISPHKGPVTRKMFPYLMTSSWESALWLLCGHREGAYIPYMYWPTTYVFGAMICQTTMAVRHAHFIMSAMSSQITGVSIIYPTVCLSVDQRKHHSSAG